MGKYNLNIRTNALVKLKVLNLLIKIIQFSKRLSL